MEWILIILLGTASNEAIDTTRFDTLEHCKSYKTTVLAHWYKRGPYAHMNMKAFCLPSELPEPPKEKEDD